MLGLTHPALHAERGAGDQHGVRGVRPGGAGAGDQVGQKVKGFHGCCAGLSSGAQGVR